MIADVQMNADVWTSTITSMAMATLGHVRLISFLGLVCAALLFMSTC